MAVGPVHAGVIEPGHFRFQCHGENVLPPGDLARATSTAAWSALLRGGPPRRAIHLAETLAGDTTRGPRHGALPGAGGARGRAASRRGRQALRAVALELERLANHTGDLGALAGDVGFLPTASYCGRLRGDFLNLAELCGNRFGRGLVRPGGVRLRPRRRTRPSSCSKRLDAACGADRSAVSCCGLRLGAGPLEDTGGSPPEMARDLGLVGPAARACGLRRDVRQDHPAASTASPTSPSPPGTPATSSPAPTCAGWRVRALRRLLRGPAAGTSRGRPGARRVPPLRARRSWWSPWSRAGAARSATWP